MKQTRRARGTGRVYKENGVYLLQYTTKDHKRKAMILRDESGAKITEERRAEAAARDFLERKIKRIDSHEKNLSSLYRFGGSRYVDRMRCF